MISPAAEEIPRPRVPGMTASVRVSRARTTVTLDAKMAGTVLRHAEARALFERLLGLCNDLGLLSEEYAPETKRLVGNFPQAFSHIALINTALQLAGTASPGEPPHEDLRGNEAVPKATAAHGMGQ